MPGIKIGSTPVRRVVLGDGAAGKPLKRVVLGDGGAGVVLWTNKPVLVITPGSPVQGQLRDALTSRGLDYATVQELPFDLDTRNVTSMSYMFNGYSALTTVPPMDTSNVTSMASMFYGCSSLTMIPSLNTGNVTSMANMFYGCSSLRDGNVKLIRPTATKPDRRGGMINISGLTREPFFLPDGTPF